MANYEMPQDVNNYGTEPGLPFETREVQVSAGDVDLSGLVVEENSANVAPHGVVLDAERFNAMSPEESFALAGKLVEDRAREANARAMTAEEEENATALEENKEYAEAIKADIEREKAMIAAARENAIAKYGADETTWPVEVKESMDKVAAEHDKHRLGWGLAGVAAIATLGGFSSDANAGGTGEELGRIIGTQIFERTQRGIDIELKNQQREAQREFKKEEARENLEIKLRQERFKLEQKLRVEENKLNSLWRQRIMEGKGTQAQYDAAFDAFAAEAQALRARFEESARLKLERLEVKAEQAQERDALRRDIEHQRATQQSIRRGLDKYRDILR
jgi:hypothetical protein